LKTICIMKKFIIVVIWIICLPPVSRSQKDATIKEFKKVFPTYPFSDPNPIPLVEKIYPYFRYDGFADKSVQKEWNVIELENDYLRVMILPEVGGKYGRPSKREQENLSSTIIIP